MAFSTSLLGEDLNNNNKKANHQLFVDKGDWGLKSHATPPTTTPPPRPPKSQQRQ